MTDTERRETPRDDRRLRQEPPGKTRAPTLFDIGTAGTIFLPVVVSVSP